MPEVCRHLPEVEVLVLANHIRYLSSLALSVHPPPLRQQVVPLVDPELLADSQCVLPDHSGPPRLHQGPSESHGRTKGVWVRLEGRTDDLLRLPAKEVRFGTSRPVTQGRVQNPPLGSADVTGKFSSDERDTSCLSLPRLPRPQETLRPESKTRDRVRPSGLPFCVGVGGLARSGRTEGGPLGYGTSTSLLPVGAEGPVGLESQLETPVPPCPNTRG